MEGVERDAHGQRHVDRAPLAQTEHADEVLREEVRVLEIRKRGQTQHDGGRQPEFLHLHGARVVQQEPETPAPQAIKEDQDDVVRIPVAIEEVARDQQNADAPRGIAHQRQQRQHHREEDEEDDGCEDHGRAHSTPSGPAASCIAWTSACATAAWPSSFR